MAKDIPDFGTMRKMGYIVCNADGEPVAIDPSSGGYPFTPHDPQQIHIFENQTEADKYVRAFPGKGYYARIATLSLEWG